MDLRGQVALVAGATRGAGRGIARALAEAGATVYCTGRSTAGQPSPYKRPETIDETAALITAAGGQAIAVRVDHTVEAEVEALVARIVGDHGRLDVLADSVAGEDPLMGQWASFWQVDLAQADLVLRQALVSRIITAKHVAPVMIRQRRGLIAEITENDILGGGRQSPGVVRQDRGQRYGPGHGRGAPRAWCDRRRSYPWIPAVRVDARWLGRDRGELAGRG